MAVVMFSSFRLTAWSGSEAEPALPAGNSMGESSGKNGPGYHLARPRRGPSVQ